MKVVFSFRDLTFFFHYFLFFFLLFKFWVQKALPFCFGTLLCFQSVHYTWRFFHSNHHLWMLTFKLKSNVNVTFLDMWILASIVPNLSALWIKSLCTCIYDCGDYFLLFIGICRKRSISLHYVHQGFVFSFSLVPSCKLCMVIALSFFIVFIVWWNSCKLWFTPINLHLCFDLNFSWFYEFAFLLYINCFMFGLVCMHHWSWS
jgi:hypothetical protein